MLTQNTMQMMSDLLLLLDPKGPFSASLKL